MAYIALLQVKLECDSCKCKHQITFDYDIDFPEFDFDEHSEGFKIGMSKDLDLKEDSKFNQSNQYICLCADCYDDHKYDE